HHDAFGSFKNFQAKQATDSNSVSFRQTVIRDNDSKAHVLKHTNRRTSTCASLRLSQRTIHKCESVTLQAKVEISIWTVANNIIVCQSVLQRPIKVDVRTIHLNDSVPRSVDSTASSFESDKLSD